MCQFFGFMSGFQQGERGQTVTMSTTRYGQVMVICMTARLKLANSSRSFDLDPACDLDLRGPVKPRCPNAGVAQWLSRSNRYVPKNTEVNGFTAACSRSQPSYLVSDYSRLFAARQHGVEDGAASPTAPSPSRAMPSQHVEHVAAIAQQ